MTSTRFTSTGLRSAVTAAIRAPSLHNSQSWRFRLDNGGIEVRIDPNRLPPISDPTRWAARLSCGAAVFNLRLALAVAGTPAEVHLRPYPHDLDTVAAGQALQRVLLTATDSRLAVSMLSQPIEVPRTREQPRLALGRHGTPQMVMRIGSGQTGWPSPRRHVNQVLDPA